MEEESNTNYDYSNFKSKQMFPKEDVIYLDISFEEASKFIVSAGTSNPN